MTEIFFSVVDVFMDQDEVQIFSHASIISNEKKPRVSYFAVAPFLFSFFLPNKECEPPLYFTNADEEAGVVPENKDGKIVFIENWPSQQFSVILFHAMNKNKNQKPLWFKWSS